MIEIEQRRAALGKEEDHPSGDNRFRMLDASMKRHRHQPDALIEVLHTAQEVFGYLQEDILQYVAHRLKLPPSRVYGVATFYHFFTFKPKAPHTCVVCLGTACYVKGGQGLLAAVREQAERINHEVRGEGPWISVETARCLGACGLAPVVVFDGEVCGNVEISDAVERMKGWRPDGSV